MKRVQESIVLTGFTMAIASIFLMAIGNQAFAIEYITYTSEKYKIQFEYPSDWTVTEKTSRFDVAHDIKVMSGPSSFSIEHYDDKESIKWASNIESATEDLLISFPFYMSIFDISTIEDPSYLTIDGQKAGTFLVLMKDKSDSRLKVANQQWIVSAGDRSYQITNMLPATDFDSPENTEIRNHFINSIKFLGNNES